MSSEHTPSQEKTMSEYVHVQGDRPMTTITPEDRAYWRATAERWPDQAWSAGTIVRLLDALDQAEAAIERVRALHAPRKEEAITGDCAIEECDHDGQCPTTPFTVCAECWRIAEESDQYFGEDGIVPVLYPCQTIRALDGGYADPYKETD